MERKNAAIFCALAHRQREKSSRAFLLVAAGASFIVSPSIVSADTLLAGWTFDSLAVGPNTPTQITGTLGYYATDATIYANGLFGSSSWLSENIQSFSGTTNNDPRSTTAAGSAFSLLGSGANGNSIVFRMPSSLYQNLEFSFSTRGTSTGFANHTWATSTNGTTYAALSTANTANTGTTFTTKEVDLTSVTGLNDQPFIYLRLTVDGATSTGNNRLDNILLSSQNFTWFGATSNVFTTAANWTAAGLASGSAFGTAPTSGKNINFQGTPAFSPSIDADTTVGQVVFNTNTTSLTIGGASNLTVNGGIDNRSTNTQTITPPIVLGAAQSFSASSGHLVLDGNINTNARALTLTGANNLSLNAAITGSGSLTKFGAGIATLSGNNSYSGITNIIAGKLIINGTLGSGGNTITVAGGTLGGSGTILRSLNINSAGTIAPGNPGNHIASLTLNDVAAVTTFGQGGAYVWEVKSLPTSGSAGSDWDFLNISTFHVLANSATRFTLKIVSLNAAGNAPGTITGVGNTRYAWPILMAVDCLELFDPEKFSINSTAFSSDNNGGAWTTEWEGSNLMLVYTVPEPAAASLLLFAAPLLARRRRRRA